MSILKEFREFADTGNTAVCIILGGALGTILKLLVALVMMLPIGLVTGGVDFSDCKIAFAKAAEGKEAVT